jgi:DNA-binding NarL/FixJ family response regulator
MRRAKGISAGVVPAGARGEAILVAVVSDQPWLSRDLVRFVRSFSALHLLGTCNPRCGRPAPRLRKAAVVLLTASGWPCAVRERIERIRGEAPRARVLLIASSSGRGLCPECLKLANGVIFTPLDSARLLKAVRAVFANRTYRDKSAWQNKAKAAAAECAEAQGAPKLTRRELEVLRLQADGLPYKQIAERLAIRQHTVTNHLFSIHQKLGVHNAIEAINKAFPGTGDR